MGCLSGRRGMEVRPEAKWDYISINDFKSTSCFTPFAYGYLYFSLILSIAVYSVDTFTAVNLLVFDRWSSEIAPTQLIPFYISKWIFSICIILSVVNLAFEHIRARRIMNRGSVAESYLDNLAVRLESVRMGKGNGWKRFLVFAELTKSKKGAEYIALFSYFSFQSWIRVILCSGPRQVVNALTLLSVYNAKLSVGGGDIGNTIMSFFEKIRALASQDYQQAVILSGMLFTLVIWVFSALSLLLACLFFVCFLWGYIPRSDGGLSGYCERKINKRLMRIVSAKVNKAIADEERLKRKMELKAAKKAGEKPPMERQATLPSFMDSSSGDKLPEMPSLANSSTSTFELGAMDQKRPMASRTATNLTTSSAATYSSRAPLMGGGSDYGMSRTASPAPSLPSVDLNNYPPVRPNTSSSNRSFTGPPPPMSRMPTNGSGFGNQYTSSPSTYSSERMPALPPSVRSPLGSSDSYRQSPGPGQYGGGGGGGGGSDRSMSNGSRPGLDEYSVGQASPAPSSYTNRSNPLSPRGAPNGYPARSATGPVPARGPAPYAPQRNYTAPLPNGGHQAHDSGSSDYFARPPTSSSQQGYRHQPTGSGASDYYNRPTTAQSQRSAPSRPPYGGGSGGGGGGAGWNADPEAQRGYPNPRF